MSLKLHHITLFDTSWNILENSATALASHNLLLSQDKCQFHITKTYPESWLCCSLLQQLDGCWFSGCLDESNKAAKPPARISSGKRSKGKGV